jgi:CRP-like cAMP-binding protein
MIAPYDGSRWGRMDTSAKSGAEPSEVFERLFACSGDVARRLGRSADFRQFPPQALILRQGEPTRETVLMISGRAQALVQGADGRQVLVQEFERGDIFGAVVLGGGLANAADVAAVEPTRAAVFRGADFLSLTERHSCLGLAVSRSLLGQLRAAHGRMAEQVTCSAAGRVYGELLRLARLGDGVRISPPPVLTALAVRVRTSRETVSRAIGVIERRGVIRREPGALVIVSPRRLEELVV